MGRLRERPIGRISQKFSFKFRMKIPPQMPANIKMRVRVLPATVSVAAKIANAHPPKKMPNAVIFCRVRPCKFTVSLNISPTKGRMLNSKKNEWALGRELRRTT